MPHLTASAMFLVNPDILLVGYHESNTEIQVLKFAGQPPGTCYNSSLLPDSITPPDGFQR